jgi:hypothetical protein
MLCLRFWILTPLILLTSCNVGPSATFESPNLAEQVEIETICYDELRDTPERVSLNARVRTYDMSLLPESDYLLWPSRISQFQSDPRITNFELGARVENGALIGVLLITGKGRSGPCYNFIQLQSKMDFEIILPDSLTDELSLRPLLETAEEWLQSTISFCELRQTNTNRWNNYCLINPFSLSQITGESEEVESPLAALSAVGVLGIRSRYGSTEVVFFGDEVTTTNWRVL